MFQDCDGIQFITDLDVTEVKGVVDDRSSYGRERSLCHCNGLVRRTDVNSEKS